MHFSGLGQLRQYLVLNNSKWLNQPIITYIPIEKFGV
uniref:Uncharacterized protein n=1 Tax=Rhizophora mucronata TaxID=61149 RepID=A0A2P2QT46_RHIMU